MAPATPRRMALRAEGASMAARRLAREESYPFEALVEVVLAKDPEASAADLAETFDVSMRTIERWKTDGLLTLAADAAAVALGYWIGAIWPAEWEVNQARLLAQMDADDEALAVAKAAKAAKAKAAAATKGCGNWGCRKQIPLGRKFCSVSCSTSYANRVGPPKRRKVAA